VRGGQEVDAVRSGGDDAGVFEWRVRKEIWGFSGGGLGLYAGISARKAVRTVSAALVRAILGMCLPCFPSRICVDILRSSKSSSRQTSTSTTPRGSFSQIRKSTQDSRG